MKDNLPTNVTKEMYNNDLQELANVLKAKGKPISEVSQFTLNKLATKNSKAFSTVEFATLYS